MNDHHFSRRYFFYGTLLAGAAPSGGFGGGARFSHVAKRDDVLRGGGAGQDRRTSDSHANPLGQLDRPPLYTGAEMSLEHACCSD